jgi:acyl-CoA thioester hydrolase
LLVHSACHLRAFDPVRALGISSLAVPWSASEFPFAHRQRVRFGETDLQGVVYYANYLLYAEVGRVAYLRARGVDYARDLIARGLDFTIAEARVRYRAPLRFDDEFDIRVRPGESRHSSWTFEYLVTRADGTACAEMATTQVMLDRATGRPTRIPSELVRALGDAVSARG